MDKTHTGVMEESDGDKINIEMSYLKTLLKYLHYFYRLLILNLNHFS